MIGDDRKKVRAIFNLLMNTKHLKFPKADVEFKLQNALTDEKEAITATFQITNPQSQAAHELIEEFGGSMPEVGGQCIFTLKIVQGKKDEDDPNQQKLPGIDANDTLLDDEGKPVRHKPAEG